MKKYLSVFVVILVVLTVSAASLTSVFAAQSNLGGGYER